MSDSLQPHECQHARPPCPSPTPRVYSNSSLLSWWCHPTISSSVVPFSSCLQSFPESGSFLKCWLFASGAQRIGASASASVLLMNIQDWFPLGLTGLISLQSRDSQEFSTRLLKSLSTTIRKHQFFGVQPLLWYNSHIRTWLLEKPYLWLYGPLVKVMSPLFKRLPSFVTSFLPKVNRCPNRDVKEGTIKLQLWVNFQEVTEDSNPSSPVHYLCDSGCARLTLHCKMGTTLLIGCSEKTKEGKYWRALPSTGIQSLWTLSPLPTGWQPLIRSWSQGWWKGCRISQVEEGKCSKVESGKRKHESKMLED